MTENKYLLKGLNCANCALKIETRVKAIPGVNEVTLNFVTKELKIKSIEHEMLENITNKLQQIVKEIEPKVIVIDLNNEIEVKYAISGLSCANCALKIEKNLKQTDGIITANLDFVNRKLKIKFAKGNQKQTFNKIQEVIDKIEPGVKLHDVESENHDDDKINIQNLVRLVIGTLIFISIIFVPKVSIFYLPLFIASYILIGGDVLLRALKNILRGQIFDENFLMTIATISAFVIKEYPEAVAVMLFYQVGERLQDLAVNRSRRSIKKLMSIRPDYANLQVGNNINQVDIDDVNVNDLIIIKAGERVPLDGVIIEGISSLDTKALTGEALPLNVSRGDKVLSGCINLNGLLTVKVTKIASESTVAKILDLVENAISKKAPTENFITKFAKAYTPVVTVLALLLAVIPPLLFGGDLREWLYRASIFLVISCPCALVLSIPLSFFSGIGNASKSGVLIKGGNYLEALNNVEIAVFDKTGTLTEGSFSVTKIVPLIHASDELLEKAAYVESFSNHPIAQSVVLAYQKSIDKTIVTSVREISGQGIIGTVNNEEIIVGNAKMMEDEHITFTKVYEQGSILYIAINKTYVGYIVVSDKIKSDAKETIKTLKALGVKKTVMLSGDNAVVVNSVGKELAIDESYGELLPLDKLNKIERLISEKTKTGKLLFVGDGINDTPVLARADIGIAMGGIGADAAIDVADVVIMTDEVVKIVSAINIAKFTRRIVWQNIIFALTIKLFFLILGSFGVATMWEAVFADVGVSLISVINSMRILRK